MLFNKGAAAIKNSIDTREKLRLNLHSLSVSELLEYGRKVLRYSHIIQ